jgi:hypothetical protein
LKEEFNMAEGKAKTRTNLKSFRFTDDVLKILESCPGESLSDKLEYMALDYKIALPAIQNEYEKICGKIHTKQVTLKKLEQEVRKNEVILQSFAKFMREVRELDGFVTDYLK